MRKDRLRGSVLGSVRQPDATYLAIPRHFSEGRAYFTAGYEPKDVIASDALFTVEDPDCFAFSVIETSMFMAWQDLVGGRLEMRKRFSNTLVWNTFPLPKLSKDQKDLIIEGGNKVLEARANYPGASLAALYAPDNMPQDLKKAHEALDKAMDRVFSDKPFRSEEERQKALLESYEKMARRRERIGTPRECLESKQRQEKQPSPPAGACFPISPGQGRFALIF